MCLARTAVAASHAGRRSPLWQQRLRAGQLLEIAQAHAEFPILIETARECLQDVYDLDALDALMQRVQRGQVQLLDVATEVPSPFAANLLFGYVAEFMYEADVPLAERRASVLSLDSGLLAELLGQVDLGELLDAGVVDQVERELQRLELRAGLMAWKACPTCCASWDRCLHRTWRCACPIRNAWKCTWQRCRRSSAPSRLQLPAARSGSPWRTPHVCAMRWVRRCRAGCPRCFLQACPIPSAICWPATHVRMRLSPAARWPSGSGWVWRWSTARCKGCRSRGGCCVAISAQRGDSRKMRGASVAGRSARMGQRRCIAASAPAVAAGRT
ncbi:hypothetical protein B0X78_11605 [bacterium AM6]|nr:hypothetical protein B0X78_11605 [bacterium AM6]